MLEFTITKTLHIDIDEILNRIKQSELTQNRYIIDIIDDYIYGLEDEDFYLIDNEIREKIIKEVLDRRAKMWYYKYIKRKRCVQHEWIKIHNN